MNKHSFLNQLFAVSILSVLLVLSSCKGEDPMEENLVQLSDIAGKWIRVESNNPVADYIRITASGSTGTVTDPAGSSFIVGDEKWASITPTTETAFSYQELGSDGLYYEATMTVVSDDELSLAVASSGAGNSQKWIRDDGTLQAEETVILDCNSFSVDRVLANTAAAVDYIIPNGCVLDVKAALVIEAGVVIEVEENGGIGVYDQGTFKAVGTESDPIIIRGKDQVQGYWRGIHIETNSINNQLDYVTVSDAGSNYVYCCNTIASLFLKGGKASIKNSTFSNGGEFGIYASGAAEFSDFEANTITTHKEAPMYIELKRAAELDGPNSDYTGNEDDYIRVLNSNVDAEIRIPENNVPYLFDADVVDITQPLAIDAGAVLVFKENGGLGVYDQGALTLNGTAAKPVVLKGLEANKGYWRGVHIETNSSKNIFTYAEISDAGGNYVYCCNDAATVYLKGGRLAISNSTLSNGDSYGLYANAASNLETFSENTITTHADYPLYMAAERFGQLDGMGSTYAGNTKDFLGMFSSDIDNDTNWPKTDVPYLVETVIDIKSPLTIAAGTELAFNEDGGLGVYDSGFLNAEGSASELIVFRGFENTNGYWRGIHIETNSSSNVLSHTKVLNAGSNYVYCCNDPAGVYLKTGQLAVQNSEIAESGGCGIFVRVGSTLSESDNTFFNNTAGDLCN